jgi:NAD(P)-dependent dehydrogenase (short-subunit alcohol dehydrogenase family)
MNHDSRFSLAGKTALVTGGTSGIGRAAALAFAAAGARVTLTGVDGARVDAIAGDLPAGVVAVRADVRDPSDTARLACHVGELYGALDVLFLNAGVARLGPLDGPETLLDEQLAVNVRGALDTLRALAPLLRPEASVIFNTSVAHALGVAGLAAYAASKGALAGLVPSLAVELAPRGIRVNAIAPGIVSTAIQAKFGLPDEVQRAVDAKFLARIPLGRFGAADEVASLALFLASPAASYITGTEIRVDGGLSASA